MAENHNSMCLLSNYDNGGCDFSKHYNENDLVYVRNVDCNKTIGPISYPFY